YRPRAFAADEGRGHTSYCDGAYRRKHRDRVSDVVGTSRTGPNCDRGRRRSAQQNPHADACRPPYTCPNCSARGIRDTQRSEGSSGIRNSYLRDAEWPAIKRAIGNRRKAESNPRQHHAKTLLTTKNVKIRAITTEGAEESRGMPIYHRAPVGP